MPDILCYNICISDMSALTAKGAGIKAIRTNIMRQKCSQIIRQSD